MIDPYLPRDYDAEFRETIDSGYDDELQTDVLAALHQWLDLASPPEREHHLRWCREDDALSGDLANVRWCLICDALSFAGWELGFTGYRPSYFAG